MISVVIFAICILLVGSALSGASLWASFNADDDSGGFGYGLLALIFFVVGLSVSCGIFSHFVGK